MSVFKKSTICLILGNIHVRLAIRENPEGSLAHIIQQAVFVCAGSLWQTIDSHSTRDTTNCLTWSDVNSDEALDIPIKGYYNKLASSEQ